MLTASIYRDDYRSTANLFNKRDRVTLVNVEGPASPCALVAPPAMLLPGHLPGTARVVPAVKLGEWVPLERPMMGGCYVASSDSRFTMAVESIIGGPFYGAVALHDRYEN